MATQVASSVTHEESSAGQLLPSRKRPFEPSEPLATDICSKHRKPLVSLDSFSATLHPVFKVPAIPPSHRSISKTPAKLAKHADPAVQTLPLLSSHTPSKTTTIKRFIPLLVKNPISSAVLNPPCTVQQSLKIDSPTVASSLQYLDFLVPRQLSLESVSLPPSLSQRKQVTRLAILLSGISLEQLKECFQVSRLFRYAGMKSTTEYLLDTFIG